MPVLIFWFVTVPAWLYDHTAPPANGGIGAALVFAGLCIAYGVVTLAALAAAVAVLRAVGRAFKTGVRRGMAGS